MNKLLLSIAILLSIGVNAQVTIGSGEKANTGALLDLKDGTPDPTNIGITASKGLGLPRVSLRSIGGDLGKSLDATVTTNGTLDKDTHIGLVVYNTNSITTSVATRLCPGIHIWDGTQWNAIPPYPPVETRQTLVGTPVNGIITLLGGYNQAIDPNDAKWVEFDKNPTDYPIGATPSLMMTDADGNNYNSQRFYVGYQTVTSKYKIGTNMSCDPENPKWVNTSGTQTVITENFVDGVWITSNMYSTQKAGGGSFSQGTDFDEKPRINPAYFITTANVSIPVDINGLSTSNTVTYGQTIAASAAGTWNNTISQKDFAIKFGLLYTHNQALQVCPAGWSLPDDADWTGLINAHGGHSIAGAHMRMKPNATSYYYFRSVDDFEKQWGHPYYETGIEPSGFNATPNGIAGEVNGSHFGEGGHWWTKSINNVFAIESTKQSIIHYGLQGGYRGVRCKLDK